jgi:Lon protease-like protein
LDDATWVGNRLAELSPFDASVRQGLMEMTDPAERLRYLAPLVQIDSGAAIN